MANMILAQRIENMIFLIRGQKVMLDRDLAELYHVRTKALIQAVKRNLGRFPRDFMFQLTWEEAKRLRSQFVTLKNVGKLAKKQEKCKRGGHIKYLPYAFTEQGIAMLSSVLRSERAIQVNIAIMRAFVKLRRILSTHKKLARKLGQLEHKIEVHDGDIKVIFDAIRRLMAGPEKSRRRIGFEV